MCSGKQNEKSADTIRVEQYDVWENTINVVIQNHAFYSFFIECGCQI